MKFPSVRRALVQCIAYLALASGLGLAGVAQAATAVDLSVSAYTWAPDPVVRGGTSSFSVTATNNALVSAADTLTLAIDLPPNISFAGQSTPANCAFNLVASPNTLTCTKTLLAAQATWTVNFNGAGATFGVQTTTATVSSSTNVDPNAGNDALTKNATVINGADLGITKTGPGGCVTATPCNANSGSIISFTLHVTNAGPDAATTFQVIDNLPAVTDFTYQSAAGTNWTCAAVGITLTCDYSGPSISLNGAAPDITVTGRIITPNGTITNGASVRSTDGSTPDPIAGNNGPSLVVVNVAAGTDLRANKSMVSVATGLTSYAVGEAVNLTLSATNLGPQAATTVTVTDLVSSDFTIGALPSGCTLAGQTISCSPGLGVVLANGATAGPWLIPLTVVGAAGNSGTNTANVTRSAPTAGSNTAAAVAYSITAPFAHLTISKNKTPTLVAAGGTITNTITVTNSLTSTSATTGTIRITDALDPNETFASSSPASWICAGVAVGATGTLNCDYAGANLARGAALPVLTIVTKASSSFLGTITNNACTGVSPVSPQSPPDSGNSCQSASVTGTPRNVDLSILKTASIPAPAQHVLISNNSVVYTLTVANAGPDVAPTAKVTDPIPGWYSGNAGTTGGSAVITAAVAGESCSFGSTVTCTLLNVTSGSPRTISITVTRPFGDSPSGNGSFTNTATVSSPDAIDTNGANNSASAAIIVDPIADVAVTSISSAPNPVKVGVQLTYTTSIKNNGPNTAAGVVLRQVIDPLRMPYVALSASLTVGGACGYVASFVGAPYAGQAGIECSGFNLSNGESRQLSFKVIPSFPYPDTLDASYTSNATITTTTVESDAPGYANNSASNTVSVTTKAIDLSVTDNDPGYDPIAFGDYVVYQVKAQNNGPSQATGFMLTVTPTPPTGGFTMTYNPGTGTVLPAGASCSVVSADVVCYLGADRAHSIQSASASATFKLRFDTGPISSALSHSVTYKTTAKVESYETGPSPYAGDSLPGNNSVTETTTVLPKTDLLIFSKSVSKPVVDLNEPFFYTIVVGNKGPSDASGVRVTDVLPAGFVRTAGAITVTPGAGVSLATNSCVEPVLGANGTVTCTLGPIPADPSADSAPDVTKQVSIKIPVRAAYVASGSYSFGSGGANFATSNPTPAITNTASVAPLPNTSIDTTPGNDTNSVTVQVRKNSIAGVAYADNNLNDAFDAGEGINSVALTLTGIDSYGYTYGSSMTYPALSTSTGVGKDGAFLFDKLPPGSWTLVETQPAGYWDRFETVGNASGTAPPNNCDGVQNCVSSGPNVAAANTISGITLPATAATAATGYLFQEYAQATISGFVYIDANNDGIKSGSSDSGIGGVTLTLAGTNYVGQLVNLTTTTSSVAGTLGAYSFTVPPADAAGYTVTETTPTGYLNGKTTAGTVTGTNAVAGTASGANSDVIQAIKVYSAGTSINNNFGELVPATLSGYVFIDSLPSTPDAVRSGSETVGVAGVTMTLVGTDDLGAPVNATAITGANGAYTFPALRPGSYAVTETTPSGLTHTGAQAGSKGGTIGGSVIAAGVLTGVTGSANTAITAITIASGDVAAGYNFGESGQGLSGFVYVDLNSNGVKDAGEPGISGVGVTLSGKTSGGLDVCVEISPNPCTVKTNSSGQYSFIGLPASDGAGYTLTEQAQTLTPLNNYADGLEQLGSGLATPGVAGNDFFTGIVLQVGAMGVNYNFGELGAKLAGAVYYDANDNGVKDGSDIGIAGVTLALSGTTVSGDDVCTLLTSLSLSCAATSAGDGTFSYSALPASDSTGYTLVETQPVDYANRSDAAGTGCGTASCGTPSVVGGNSRISAIKLAVGANAVNYLFGEKTGTLSGFVYFDNNNNGVMDAGEVGIAGVTLTLSGSTASGAAVCGSCTTVTASDGSYSFGALKNANGLGYTVTETQPSAYRDGRETAGTQGGVVDNSSFGNAAAQNRISAIPFNAANAATGYNFGEIPGSISGFVYVDVNINNAYDPGTDTPIQGATVILRNAADLGNLVATTTTDANGAYSFSVLNPTLTYVLEEPLPISPAGLVNRTSAVNVGTVGGVVTGAAAGNTPALGTDRITGISVRLGDGINYNFGEDRSSSIGGAVFYDRNRNGGFDSASEPGIGGVTVKLVLGSDCAAGAFALPGLTNPVLTAATTGAYLFAGVPAGAQYSVCETQPMGYADGPVGPATSITIASLALGGSVGNNFPEILGSIGGYVYLDSNVNGLRDNSDTGIAGVSVTLSGVDIAGTSVNRSMVTDALGHYQFDDLLAAGVAGYTVTEQLAQPFAPGTQIPTVNGVTVAGTIAGVSTGTATPVSVLPSAVSAIALPAGAQLVENDFGELLVQVPDLVVTKTSSKPTFTEGNQAIYTLTVKNQGWASTVGTYTVVDRLPATTTPAKWAIESAAGTGWTCTLNSDHQQVSCDSAQVLGAGQTSLSTIQLSVSFAQGAAAFSPLRNVVSVTGGGEPTDKLPQPGDLASPQSCGATPLLKVCQLSTPVQLSAGMDGHVWIDGSNKKVLDGSAKLLPGWIVEVYDVNAPSAAGKTFADLVRADTPIRTTTTDAQGHYQLCGLEPGTGYRVLFRDPANRIAFPGVVTNESGNVTDASYWSQVRLVENFQVLQVTLPQAPAGASSSTCNVSAMQQSLPLDPNGVVYDSKTRQPVPGAIVSFVPEGNCSAYDPKLYVINYETYGKDAAGNPSMTTGADGFYKFLLSGDPSAPKSCQFRLVVTAPNGYNPPPSTVIAPKAALATPPAPGIYNVQPQRVAPTGNQDTSYHFVMALGLSHQEIFNNHIPLDPTIPGTLALSKIGDKRVAMVGDSVLYTLTLLQTAGDPTPQVTLKDRLPAGFTLIKGTVRLNSVAALDPQGGLGPTLAFNLGTLKTGQQVTLTYRVRVGVGAQQGDGINRAQGFGCRVLAGCVAAPTFTPIPAAVASNEARFQVQVSGGVFTDSACLAGKIFVDCNNNHVQDPEELGIPGVRLYLESGQFLISDSEGKYSQCGLTPRSHVLKVDAASLPRGSRLTTSSNRNLGDAGSLLLDLKNGELMRADFVEGSCSNTVLEQVKARRAQGEVRSVESERATDPPLRFESKPPTAPQQATDSANQALAQPRWSAPPSTNNTTGADHAR